jgi:hypothetical protein
MKYITTITEEVIEDIISLEPEHNVTFKINTQRFLYVENAERDEDDLRDYYIAVYKDLDDDEPISQYAVPVTHQVELVDVLNEITETYGAFTQEEIKIMYVALRQYQEKLNKIRDELLDGDMSKAAYMVNDKITIAFHANEKLCSMMDNEED